MPLSRLLEYCSIDRQIASFLSCESLANFRQAWNENTILNPSFRRRSVNECIEEADNLHSAMLDVGMRLQTVDWSRASALRKDICTYLQTEGFEHFKLPLLRSKPICYIFEAVEYIDEHQGSGSGIDNDLITKLEGCILPHLNMFLRILIGHELFSFCIASQALFDESQVLHVVLQEFSYILQYWDERKIQDQIVFDRTFTVQHYSTIIEETIVQGANHRKLILLISALRMLEFTELESENLVRVLIRIAQGKHSSEGLILCLTNSQFLRQISFHEDVLHPLMIFLTWACRNDHPSVVELLVHVFHLPFFMNHSHAPAQFLSECSNRVLQTVLQPNSSTICTLEQKRISLKYATNLESSPHFFVDFDHMNFTPDQQASALRKLGSSLAMVHLGDMPLAQWRQHFDGICQTCRGKAADLMWVKSQQEISKRHDTRVDQWWQQFRSSGQFSLGLYFKMDLAQNIEIENVDPFGAIHHGLTELTRPSAIIEHTHIEFIRMLLDEIPLPEWLLAFVVQRVVLHRHEKLLDVFLSRGNLRPRLYKILSCPRFKQRYLYDSVQSDNPLWYKIEKFLHPKYNMQYIVQYMNQEKLEARDHIE